MGFKILYPQGRWMDVTIDIGMTVDYFIDFDGEDQERPGGRWMTAPQ
jgi:hypothetical protein